MVGMSAMLPGGSVVRPGFIIRIQNSVIPGEEGLLERFVLNVRTDTGI